MTTCLSSCFGNHVRIGNGSMATSTWVTLNDLGRNFAMNPRKNFGMGVLDVVEMPGSNIDALRDFLQ